MNPPEKNPPEDMVEVASGHYMFNLSESPDQEEVKRIASIFKEAFSREDSVSLISPEVVTPRDNSKSMGTS